MVCPEVIVGGDGSPVEDRRKSSRWSVFGLRDVPAEARPLLIGSALQTLATAGFSTYVGLWAVLELDAPGVWLGVALALRAGSGVITGYAGGALSDRVNRRPIVLLSWAAQALCIAAFVLVERSVIWGLALIVAFGPLGPPGRAAAAAYLADVTVGNRRARVYASQRSLQAVGQVLGPGVGALLVIGSAWDRMFLGFAVVSAVAVVLAFTMSARSSEPSQEARESAPGAAGASSLWSDTTYLLLLLVITLLTITMAASDRFLPIAAVDEYGVEAAMWGLIAAINPVLVIGLQSAVTRRSERWNPVTQLWVSAALVGLPFLLLLQIGGPVSVAAVVFLSTLGEMIWMPLSQALGAEWAPADRRGAYLGAYDGARSLAFALGPLLALSLADFSGYPPVWVCFAVLSVVAVVVGAGPVRRAGNRLREASESAAP